MTQFFPLLADKQLSPTPARLTSRYISGQMMRWDGPPSVELDGECPWSWLAAAHVGEASG